MAHPTWTGDKLWRLLNLSWAEFHAIYPDIKKNTYKGKLHYWRTKLTEGKIKMPPSPEQEGRLVSTWEMMHKDNEGEAHITRLHKYDHTPDASQLAEQYPPIEPARITPTRRRAAQRLSKMLLVYGDGQVDFRRRIDPVTDEMELIPLHNVPMYNIIRQINADHQPDETVNLGDFADMAALSRFPKDSDHFHKTLGPSLRWIHDFYAQMRADNPRGKHTEVDSNHAIRVRKRTLDGLDALYDFVIPGEDYPVLSYYRLANLGAVGVNFVSGYGAAEYVYGDENPIVFKHGTATSSVPGATVRKEAAQNPSVNIVRGHGHSDEEVRQTTRDGRQLVYKMLGSSCLNNGPVPGYHSAIDDHNRPVNYHNQNHQNTLLIIEDYGGGRYNFQTIDVVDGKAFYRGKEYDGRTDGQTTKQGD